MEDLPNILIKFVFENIMSLEDLVDLTRGLLMVLILKTSERLK